MKTIVIFIAGLVLTVGAAFAQHARFTTSGVIEYEKSVNMFALLKREMDLNKNFEAFYRPIYEQYLKNQPQFKKLKSTLAFADNKTLFIPVVDDNPPVNFFGNTAMVTQNNTVFTDLQSATFISQKTVFDDAFLVKDSTRRIRWKITDETREIAGFTCRRANAIVMDSIYVVAFYADQISVSGGPESFTGLPGMILGLALPHENITWFATKVTDMTIENKALLPPKKGKPVNSKELSATLATATKNWGVYKQAYLKAFLL